MSFRSCTLVLTKVPQFRQMNIELRTMQSTIIGKVLRENEPAGGGKLQHEFRVPISNNYAHLSKMTK